MSLEDYDRSAVHAGSIGERETYATEIDGLWSVLSLPLARLDALADEPDRLADDPAALESLPRFQYVLHAASERALGIDPPPDAEAAHTELAAALTEARDLTAELHDAVAAEGRAAARGLVYEWRGALFRLRLARMRLGAEPEASEPEPPDVEPTRASAGAALLATALLLAGTAAFVLGAALELWPIWAGGLAVFAGGCAVYRGPTAGSS